MKIARGRELLIDFLRKNRIILPAITTLERMVWEARARAEKKLLKKKKLEEIITFSIHPNPIKRYWIG